jgi:hypothetical protein
VTDVRDYLKQVREIAGQQTVRVLCPTCGGGTRGEATFSVTFEGMGLARFCCHRASCGLHGQMALSGEAPPPSNVWRPRPLLWGYATPGVGSYLWSKHRYRLREHDDWSTFSITSGLYHREDEPSTAVWECHSVDGMRLGHHTRTADKGIQNWRILQRPMHYAMLRADAERKRSCWIVEDPMSAALLAWTGENAIALLGTHLTPELLRVLPDGYVYRVALDPDAFDKAITLTRKLRDMGLQAACVPLARDIKDMEPGFRDLLIAKADHDE